jgi:transcriptional regulator with XRE-family HTH domain
VHSAPAVNQNDGMESATNMRASFGKRLRRARVASGYATAREFAIAVGLDEKVYGNYELGKRIPELPVLHRICHTLKVTSDYLLFGEPGGLSVQLYRQLVSDAA